MTVTATADVALTIGGKPADVLLHAVLDHHSGFLCAGSTRPSRGMFGSLTTTGDNCSGVLIHIGTSTNAGSATQGRCIRRRPYKYTDPYGGVYTIGSDGALQSLKDLNGNTLTLAASGSRVQPDLAFLSYATMRGESRRSLTHWESVSICLRREREFSDRDIAEYCEHRHISVRRQPLASQPVLIREATQQQSRPTTQTVDSRRFQMPSAT